MSKAGYNIHLLNQLNRKQELQEKIFSRFSNNTKPSKKNTFIGKILGKLTHKI